MRREASLLTGPTSSWACSQSRDGSYYSVLLEYLRTGDLVVPQTMKMESVLREAEFCSISLNTYNKELELRHDGLFASIKT
jgi:hypothetical protein